MALASAQGKCGLLSLPTCTHAARMAHMPPCSLICLPCPLSQEKVPFLPGMCAVLSRAHFNAFGAHFVHFAITSHFCTCSVHFYVWTCHLHSSSFNFVRQHSNGFTRLRRISHAQFMIRSFIYIRAHWNKHTFCAYQSVRLTATFVCIWRRHTFMRAFLAVYIAMCISCTCQHIACTCQHIACTC